MTANPFAKILVLLLGCFLRGRGRRELMKPRNLMKLATLLFSLRRAARGRRTAL